MHTQKIFLSEGRHFLCVNNLLHIWSKILIHSFSTLNDNILNIHYFIFIVIFEENWYFSFATRQSTQRYLYFLLSQCNAIELLTTSIDNSFFQISQLYFWTMSMSFASIPALWPSLHEACSKVWVKKGPTFLCPWCKNSEF